MEVVEPFKGFPNITVHHQHHYFEFLRKNDICCGKLILLLFRCSLSNANNRCLYGLQLFLVVQVLSLFGQLFLWICTNSIVSLLEKNTKIFMCFCWQNVRFTQHKILKTNIVLYTYRLLKYHGSIKHCDVIVSAKTTNHQKTR